MHLVHQTLTVSAWLLALAWLAKLVEAARGFATIPNLLMPEHDSAPAHGPSVTVIVPARNEAANVGACLESLLAQDYRELRILAVDDRSTDETRAVIEVLARAHADRLEVADISELPPNWLGKTHAMAVAARSAIAAHQPDYLLFTDADIVFRPDAIRRSLANAVATQADHFVVLPTTIARTRGEAMILAFLQVMSLWAIRPWRVADPRAMRDAIGVGAFNLIRTPAYEMLGGFEVAPMEILEDLALGRRVKRAGLRQRVATAPGMVSVHWAPGMMGIVAGMTKNLFAVFRFRPALLLAADAWMVLFCVAPVGFLAYSDTCLQELIALASVFGLYALSGRTSRIPPIYAASFPVGAVVVAYSMLRSMAITIRDGGVTWRGTFYPLNELRAHALRDL
jgi:glycosyltransferase involved in cell wall biosynthesis